MKNRFYDYSGFTIKRITDPKYRHILLLLGWVWYLTMFMLTEQLIPAEKCHIVHSRIDDLIPFTEQFVFFYVGWYIYVVGSLLYFFLFDVESFKSLQIYIIVTQVLAMVAYLAWPSVQYLRPEVFPRENIWTFILGIIYRFDTPTGVCPSLHVAYSMGVVSVWLKRKNTHPVFKILITAFALGVCLAVMFVKQHSFVDVIAAIPVCLTAELFTFRKKHHIFKFGRNKNIELSV